MAEHLTKETFIEKVFDYENEKEWKYKGERPAIIDFYAVEYLFANVSDLYFILFSGFSFVVTLIFVFLIFHLTYKVLPNKQCRSKKNIDAINIGKN